MKKTNLENPIYLAACKISDFILLNLLWLLFCVPILTAGAATCALYHTYVKLFRQKEGTLWAVFWKSFCENLKQGTALFLLCLSYTGLIVAAIFCVEHYFNTGTALDTFYPALLRALLLPLILIFPYIFSYLSHFRATVRQTLAASFVLSVRNLPRTLWMLFVISMELLLCRYFLLFVLVAPVLAVQICAPQLEGIFRQFEGVS